MSMILRRLIERTHLPKLLPSRRRKDFTLMRAHQRHPCCALASMLIVERNVVLDGLVLEVSLGGMLFREASSFIFDRYGAHVRVRVAGFDMAGTIANVRPSGYGIHLAQPLTRDELETILDQTDAPKPRMQ